MIDSNMELYVATNVASVFLVNVISDTYRLIRDSATTKNPHFESVMRKLDLEADLRVIEALVKSDKPINEAQRLAIKNVSDMVGKIKGDLEKISRGIEYDMTRYLNSWRSPTYLDILKQMENHKKILDMRVTRLVQILSI